jgi:hypothetical protein
VKKIRPLIFILFIFSCCFVSAQNRYKKKGGYKVGAKFSAERAGWRNNNPKLYPVYNGGFQFVGNFGRSPWSLETGLYLTTKIPDFTAESVKYRFLNLPVNIRWDNNGFYFSAGVFTDYLIFINTGHGVNDPLDPARKPSFGLNGAVGYEKNIYKNINVLFELRGFRTIVEADYTGFSSYGLAVGLNYAM